MQVRSEEERQSGSSSGCVGRLRVHRTACSSDLSCRKSRWPSLGRLLCARFISIEHDAFFSFYRPQMGARIKNGLGGLLPTTATGLACFWAWDQKPRTARCRMRDRRGKREGVTAPGCSLPGQRLFCLPAGPRARAPAIRPYTLFLKASLFSNISAQYCCTERGYSARR